MKRTYTPIKRENVLSAEDDQPVRLSSDIEPASASAVASLVGDGGKICLTEPAGTEAKVSAQLVADFLASAPQKLASVRTGHRAFVNSSTDESRLAQLLEMHWQVRSLADAAGVVGFRKIAHLAGALEALLIQLHDKPAKITPSSIRTIGQAVDLLAFLCEHATNYESDALVSPTILVVDDEVISREVVCAALEKAGLHAMSVESPMVAQGLLEQTQFDLIFLDVEMPGQSGLDLCASIRKTTTNHATPVVFVTAHSDFGSRAQSSLSGGNDFIAKPFLSVELTVKALTWLFKEKLPQPSTKELTGADGGLRATPNETRQRSLIPVMP